MSPEAAGPTDWRDSAAYASLRHLDRAELDWLFAARHAEAVVVASLCADETVLRREPSIRLLTLAPDAGLAPARGLRFR